MWGLGEADTGSRRWIPEKVGGPGEAGGRGKGGGGGA